MRVENLNREELIGEVARLNRNLSRRLKNISKIPNDYRLENDALSKYEKLKNETNKTPSKMSDKELRSYYRDLKYIDSLKTASYKGAVSAANNFKSFEKHMSYLSPNTRDKLWGIYGKLYERHGDVIDRFKYNIFDLIDRKVIGGDMDDESLLNNIISAFENAYGESGSYTSKDFDKKFEKELEGIDKNWEGYNPDFDFTW